MPFKISEEKDITLCKVDAIVNSVGTETTVLGGICRSILLKANSSELHKIIEDANNVYYVGEFFVTKGYNLPAKQIIHLISPNFENDKDYSVLKDCLRRILNECKKQHFKTVAIPKIACGANGYDGKNIETIIEEMCTGFCKTVDDSITFSLVIPDLDISKKNHERLEEELFRRGSYHTPNEEKKFAKQTKLFKKINDVGKTNCYDSIYFDYKSYKSTRSDYRINSKDLKEIKCINDYVDCYVYEISDTNEQKRLHDRICQFFAYGRGRKGNLLYTGSDIYGEIKYNNFADKEDFYKIIFALKMTIDEATQFMNFFGYTFARSGVSKEDDLVKMLLAQHQYSIVEIDTEFRNSNLKSIFEKKRNK